MGVFTRSAVVGIGAASVLVLSSCSTEEIDIATIEQRVAEEAEERGLGAPDDFSCGSVLSLSEGASLRCALGYDEDPDRVADVSVTRVANDAIGLDVDIK